MNVSPYRFFRFARRTVVTLAVLAGCWFAYAYWQLPSVDPAAELAPPDEDAHDWPEPATFEAGSWSTIQRIEGTAPPRTGPLGQRFRLAGTFFAYPGEEAPTHSGTRHAILDDVEQRRQHLLQEGDEVEAMQVVSIYRDRIVLRGQAGEEEELWLSFSGTGAPEETRVETAEQEEDVPARFEDMPALDTSRFGKRIGDNRWVFQRDELLDYFDELQDDPERLTAIFMAMQPDYHETEDRITGFQLDMLGEDVLYEAAGFQNGDIVRKVNSMPMTSPARAEYFIREFLNERVSAVVFDIEREGEEQQLIHLIR